MHRQVNMCPITLNLPFPTPPLCSPSPPPSLQVCSLDCVHKHPYQCSALHLLTNTLMDKGSSEISKPFLEKTLTCPTLWLMHSRMWALSKKGFEVYSVYAGVCLCLPLFVWRNEFVYVWLTRNVLHDGNVNTILWSGVKVCLQAWYCMIRNSLLHVWVILCVHTCESIFLDADVCVCVCSDVHSAVLTC